MRKPSSKYHWEKSFVLMANLFLGTCELFSVLVPLAKPFVGQKVLDLTEQLIQFQEVTIKHTLPTEGNGICGKETIATLELQQTPYNKKLEDNCLPCPKWVDARGTLQ